MPLAKRTCPDRRVFLLTSIRLLHTVLWAFFALCILLLPYPVWRGRLDWFFWQTGAILLECLTLALFRGRCPLTLWAARYTEERTANFDIYLPRWLAKHNKSLFGFLFLVNLWISYCLYR